MGILSILSQAVQLITPRTEGSYYGYGGEWVSPAPTGTAVVEHEQPYNPLEQFANLIRIGSDYHGPAANGRVEKEEYYYWYTRPRYRTDAIAAAFTAAFGPDALEEAFEQGIQSGQYPDSMIQWQLSNMFGFDLRTPFIQADNGVYSIFESVDAFSNAGWTRNSIADWLSEAGAEMFD